MLTLVDPVASHFPGPVLRDDAGCAVASQISTEFVGEDNEQWGYGGHQFKLINKDMIIYLILVPQ